MLDGLIDPLAELPPAYLGILGSLVAGLATGLGALPVFFVREISERAKDVLLGGAAGVMLGAAFFSLIVPGLDAAHDQSGTVNVAVAVVATGILVGGALFFFADRLMPPDAFFKRPGAGDPRGLRRAWLFVIAIALHNLPEGLAVGVGFASEDLGRGLALMLGIGLQNMPEGLVVAVALRREGYGRTRAFLIALFTGLVEVLGAAFGVGTVALAAALLPWMMAFAAGAMVFVISQELIPESQRRGFDKEATAALIVGLVVMMALDVGLTGLGA